MTLPVSALTTDHDLVVAAGEEAASLEVHGEAGGRFAGSQRPAMRLGELLRVNLDEFGGVFVVDEHAPLPSATANSGLPPRGIVPTTVPSVALMAVAFFPRPLKVKTRLETLS